MSFMVATTVLEAIVLAADSRGVISVNGTEVAYLDIFERVYPLQDRPIAITWTGPNWLNKSLIPRLLSEFETSLSGNESINQIACGLNEYFKENAEEPAFPEEGHFFIVAGYEGKQPLMLGCAVVPGVVIGSPMFGFIRSSDPSYRPVRPCAEMDLGEAIEFAKGSIEAFTKIGANWVHSGGPTDILVVRNSGWEWHSHKSLPCPLRTTYDLVAAGNRGVIKAEPIPPRAQFNWYEFNFLL